MRYGLLVCSTWAAILAAALCAFAQQSAELHTTQTTVKLEAGPDAPRLVSLGHGDLAPWINEAPETLIPAVEMKGASVPLRWSFDSRSSYATTTSIAYVYLSASPRLRLTWEWKARSDGGPVEHTVSIENQSSEELWLPLQDSFRFHFPAAADSDLKHMYVDKGMGRPSQVGTHTEVVKAGYRWEGRSSTYARNEDEREIIPWFMVQREGAEQDGWYIGIEFSGRTHLTLQREADSISGAAGLNPNPGPFRTRLLPHESFVTPTVFVGGFAGGPDGLGNTLRPWVRQVLNNPATWKNPAYPTLVNNSWGSGMQIDEALALRMLRDSAELGLELFAIDAGWFRGVGDWYPNPGKFPHGLAPIADEAHRRGLKFGIWVDWAQGGIDTNPGALNVNNPKTRNWMVADVPENWKPDDFVGRAMDIGFPPAKKYAQKEVERLVVNYHLDMLEHDGYLVAKNCARTDHPHAVAKPAQMSTVKGNGVAMPDASNSTDVSYHSVHAYYDIYAETRKQHPDLIFEICNDGGRMVDFGSASHGDYFSITDAYDPLSNRRAFYDASHLLPAAMLEDYVEKWPTPRIENFRYMLRSGMMGWLTIMLDTNAWTPEQHAAAKEEFAYYKQELRPLIRDADLYHVSDRPDGIRWDGLEYYDPHRQRGVLFAFRGSDQSESEHRFKLQGLLPDATYRLRFHDNTSVEQSVRGAELMTTGVKLDLPNPLSSELVSIEEAASSSR